MVREVEVLRQQLIESVSVQEARLKALEGQDKEIERDLQLVVAPDTSAAFDFRNQLSAAQLLLQVESGDAAFRIDRLRGYLAKNY